MCTALTLRTKDGHHLFGRSMDLEYNFNQQVIFVPRGFQWQNVLTKETMERKYAVLGMGTMMKGHPMFADGCNEKGLGCAGLNFPGYAYYENEVAKGYTNIAPYDLIFWLLSTCETLVDVRQAIETLNLVGIPFIPEAPLPTLHWIVTDRSGDSIVIEKTKEGVKIFENTVGVMTNAPTFDWHLTHLRQYLGLQSTQPVDATWFKSHLKPLGQGLGLHGMPGDFTPPSRFVRAAYLKGQADGLVGTEESIGEFFHILDNVSMVRGSVITPEGKDDITLYSACMCQEEGAYYYKTYLNNQINKIAMENEDLDAQALKVFEYRDKQVFFKQN